MSDDRPVAWKPTEHARTVLAERGIEATWVDRVLWAPDRVEVDARDPALRHALGRIAERDQRTLRVVYRSNESEWLIVTAFFDRREARRP